MPNTSDGLSKKLISHLNNMELTRSKSEILLSSGHLSNRDVNLIYSGLYIEAVTSFERFLEDLFICLISNQVIHLSKRVKVKTIFDSKNHAWYALHGERNFIDWFPYKHTSKRAKAFFYKGLPFTGLDKYINIATTASLDKRIINFCEKLLIIRNVIAHKSNQSKKRFYSEIVSKTSGLRSKEKKPVGYLRGTHTVHPVLTTRYQQIIDEIKFVSILITSKSLK